LTLALLSNLGGKTSNLLAKSPDRKGNYIIRFGHGSLPSMHAILLKLIMEVITVSKFLTLEISA